jgi:hypothetical protein
MLGKRITYITTLKSDEINQSALKERKLTHFFIGTFVDAFRPYSEALVDRPFSLTD